MIKMHLYKISKVHKYKIEYKLDTIEAIWCV